VQTDLVSDKEQAVEFKLYSPTNAFHLDAALNGERIAIPGVFRVRAGTNRLMLIYGNSITAFAQLVKPGTTERPTGLRFELPPRAAAGAAPYVAYGAGPVRYKGLAGTWRAKLVHPLKPADQKPADPGVSAETKALVAADFNDADWQEVPVPSKWEQYGGAWADADGEAVFRRVVDVPENWAGQDLTLTLGAIDDFDDTFWNGTPVGRTDNTVPAFWSVARQYRIPGSLVKAGRAVVAVRVFDHFGDGGLVGKGGDLAIYPAENAGR
jgi:hypothetical protein